MYENNSTVSFEDEGNLVTLKRELKISWYLIISQASTDFKLMDSSNCLSKY